MPYQAMFFRALAVTIAAETAVLAALCFRFHSRPMDWDRILSAGFFASFGTLPYLWFVLPALVSNRVIMIPSGEAAVILLEIPVLRYFLSLTWKKAGVFSAVCNAVSIGVGLLLFS